MGLACAVGHTTVTLRDHVSGATLATTEAAFDEEIVAFEIGGRRPTTVSVDEHPRRGTTVESLGALPHIVGYGGRRRQTREGLDRGRLGQVDARRGLRGRGAIPLLPVLLAGLEVFLTTLEMLPPPVQLRAAAAAA